MPRSLFAMPSLKLSLPVSWAVNMQHIHQYPVAVHKTCFLQPSKASSASYAVWILIALDRCFESTKVRGTVWILWKLNWWTAKLFNTWLCDSDGCMWVDYCHGDKYCMMAHWSKQWQTLLWVECSESVSKENLKCHRTFWHKWEWLVIRQTRC